MRRRPTSRISETPSDYAGAVALQTKKAQQQRLESLTQAEIKELLAKEDYAGAASIQKEMKSIADRAKPAATQTTCAEQQQLDAQTAVKIKELIAKEVHAGAAALQTTAKTRAVETPITMELIQEQRGAVKAEYEAKLKGHMLPTTPLPARKLAPQLPPPAVVTAPPREHLGPAPKAAHTPDDVEQARVAEQPSRNPPTHTDGGKHAGANRIPPLDSRPTRPTPKWAVVPDTRPPIPFFLTATG